MTGELRAQIRNNLNLQDSKELLAIWQTNDRAEWSEEAFAVIREILDERGVDLPSQNEPIYEHKEEAQKEDEGFSAEALRIIDDDENPPAFYDPFETLLTAKRIDWMAKAMIGFTIAYSIINFQAPLVLIQSFFHRNPDSPLIYIFTALMLALNAALGIVVVYFPLKALAHILRILMEMEFKSRKRT